MIVGNPADSHMDAHTPTPYDTAVPQAYAQNQPVGPPMIDSAELVKMSPQVLVLLILAGFKRTWKWTLPTGLVLGAITAATCYLLFPVKYEATAWLRIHSQRPHLVFSDKAETQYKTYVQTQISLIRSPLILEPALRNPEVVNLPCVQREKDKVAWLGGALQIGVQRDSELLTISIQTEERTDADKIVNAVVDAFFENYAKETTDKTAHLISQLDQERRRLSGTASLLQDEITARTKEAAKQGGTAGEAGLAGGFGPNESLSRDVQVNESRLIMLRADLKMLQERAAGRDQLPQTMVRAAITNNPQLAAINTQLAERRERFRILKESLAREDDLVLIALEHQIADLEKNLENAFAEVSSSTYESLHMGMAANLEQQIWEKTMAIRSLEIFVNDLKQKYEEQRNIVGDRTETIADVSSQKIQLARVNGVLDQLENRIAQLNTERYAPQQIVQTKPATAPLEAKIQKRMPMTALGGFVSFCFPLFLGVAFERLRPRLYHVSQIRRGIPSVVLGEIMEPPVAWIHGNKFRKRLARYRESVHNWCTHLLLSDPFRRCKTLSVASVSGDDGKTFLAVQVAVAMAQMKSGPVLLIDADMQVGRLHLLFGNEEAGIGLADVLSFRHGFGEAVVMNEREPNLHLLSAGQLDVSPYELLGDGRFRELLDTLENHYSLILVVLPPVANAAESLIMASSTDSVLLCVRQGETVLAAMENVLTKLVNTGSSVDGIVVKDIPYYQMASKDGGFADKLEQIRLAHLLQYTE